MCEDLLWLKEKDDKLTVVRLNLQAFAGEQALEFLSCAVSGVRSPLAIEQCSFLSLIKFGGGTIRLTNF